MHTIPLRDGWTCLDTAPGAGDPAALTRGAGAGWQPIPVPGDVNAMLRRTGRIPDPHVDDQARQAYWISGRDWWLRLAFETPTDAAPCTDLCLDGVDGHADLFLNGEGLGCLRNAFRPHRVEVGDRLARSGVNVLLLRFRALDTVLGSPRDPRTGRWPGRRVLMRKPQFSFGWDWSLPLPSIGILGGVRLERHAGARLLDVGVQPRASGRVDFFFQVTRAAREAGYELVLRIRGPGAALEQRVRRPGRVQSYGSVRIPDPRLWWPNGFGAPALYTYRVELRVGGQVVDVRAGRFGLRDIRLLEEPFTADAGPGCSFWLTVNGRRVFCKGANWVPLEMWPAEATDGAYRWYVTRAADARFNMLRVWGGGLYEREAFYDLCDARGLLVWQDFMFASGGYPVDLLRDEIAAEADYQIRRLRNRACLALWCGCNEDIFSWALPDERALATADTGEHADAGGVAAGVAVNRLRDDPQIYTLLLRGLVSKLGFGAPYIESSPQSHDDVGNLPESGNSHLSCWKYALFQTPAAGPVDDALLASGRPVSLAAIGSRPERFRGHFETVCSFNSEFCIQGPAPLATLRRFLSPAHRWPPDDVWTFHLQRGHARLPHHEQTRLIAEALFGPIRGLEDYVKFGQAAHAEMMRAEFESARRDRPNNGGTLVWMLNDCWPTSNWSVMDYFRRPKPAYYAARRACAPRLAIIMERAGRVEWFWSNDTAEPCQAEIEIGQQRLDGGIVWSRTARAAAGPCETVRLFALERAALELGPGDYLFAAARVAGSDLPRAAYFPNLWRNVPWPRPRLALTRLDARPAAGGRWRSRWRVGADVYARGCHLVPPEEAAPFWLDDNFFDLCPGESREVLLTAACSLDAADIRLGDWHSEWP